MSKGFASNYRIGVVAVGLFVCFGFVAARLISLHVYDRPRLLRTIDDARRRVVVERARRGDILDTRGALLATSQSVIVLGVDPNGMRTPKDQFGKIDKLYDRDRKNWPKLAELIGLPLADLERIFNTKTRPVPAPGATAKSGASASAAAVSFNIPPPSDADQILAASQAADDNKFYDDDNDLAAAAAVGEKPAPAFQFNVTPANLAAAASAADSDDDNPNDPGDDKPDSRKIRWVKLADNVSQATLDAVNALNIQGVYAPPQTWRRVYPHHSIAAQIVGFVDHGQKPALGIERYGDFYLRGHDGWRDGESDGHRRELAQFRTRDVPCADGFNITLSLDANVQDIVEQELAWLAQRYQPSKATIIVSDPRTGFILGLGSYPSFDPNEYNKISKEEQFRLKNVAISDVYEPGSVFKIVAAAGALEDHLVTTETMFDVADDHLDYRGASIKLPAEDHHFTESRVPLTRVISYSSNRGAAHLAALLGEERFYSYARAFGFGTRTGFPGGHEEPGLMPTPPKWKDSDQARLPYGPEIVAIPKTANWDGKTITRMPMGQGLAVTVMQMHQAMGVIASGGVRLRPQIISKITDSSGEVVYRFDRLEENRVVSEQTARTVAQMLMGVASENGTAPEAAIPGYECAGKTGTAQKVIGGKYSKSHHVASFIGFFPASAPQVAISVVVDDADAHAPLHVAYGKTVAAPSFKHIGEQLISYLDIKPPGTPVIHQTFLAATEGGHR